MKNTPPMNWDTVFSMNGYNLGVYCEEDEIAAIAFLPTDHALRAPTHTLARQAKTALQAYIKHPQGWTFDLPLKRHGTAFQNRVWEKLRTISCGETLSYKNIATAIKSAPRAVGGACAANPFVIAVPCHRVVAAHGLGGFSGHSEGAWPRLKRHLLLHEGVDVAQRRAT